MTAKGAGSSAEAHRGNRPAAAVYSDDDRFLLDRQHCRPRFSGAGRKIGGRRPAPPLPNRLLIDAEALRQRPQALLTMLYRSTDRLCRRGAPMKNLAHSASFDSDDNNVPSKPGIKPLVPLRRPKGPAKSGSKQPPTKLSAEVWVLMLASNFSVARIGSHFAGTEIAASATLRGVRVRHLIAKQLW